MTLDFSWAGIPACGGRSAKNPAFTVRNAPKSTNRLVFTLNQPTYEYGGQEVPYPPNGIVQRGLFFTIGPCNSGLYTWKVKALDLSGKVVATAEKSRQFPDAAVTSSESDPAAERDLLPAADKKTRTGAARR
jgi:hypothetical protein